MSVFGSEVPCMCLCGNSLAVVQRWSMMLVKMFICVMHIRCICVSLEVLRCIKSRAFDTLAAAKNNFFFIKNS